jgi:capsular polysaccharide export protein
MNMPSFDNEMTVEVTTNPRHFLFLQGLPGPSMRRISAELQMRGHQTSRVNFNGGDIWDWRSFRGHNFRGALNQFASWLEQLVIAKSVTDIVLFGDSRPYHRIAISTAKQLGIKVYVLEEGVLRPNFVSLEIGGTNHYSNLPRRISELEPIAALKDPAIPIENIRSSVPRRSAQAIAYYVAQIIAAPYFSQYRTHRNNTPAQEMRGWITRYFGRAKEAEKSRREMASMGEKRFFLFPMQIDGDSQITHHSDFSNMSGALDCVLHSFAVHSPDDANLLIKMHPFDPDVFGWRNIVRQKAANFGIAHKVYFIERYDLEPLLKAALGVVTINSTVGPLALAAGCPVFCMGRAIYAIPGVTADCGMEEFWQHPPLVNNRNFDIFCDALQVFGLINGGFHDRTALDMLVSGAADRIDADSSAHNLTKK